MENDEGYDGGQKRARIYYVNKRTDARPKIYYHVEHRLPLRNMNVEDVRQ